MYASISTNVPKKKFKKMSPLKYLAPIRSI